MQTRIVLYSVPDCAPCRNLKTRLKDLGIHFEEVDARELSDHELNRVSGAIIAVSRVQRRSFPAVMIDRDGIEIWFSNHGEMNIAPMVREITAAFHSQEN